MKLESFAAQMQSLHQDAQDFAEQYPEQANKLNLQTLQDRDPYVERLLEGVAFLTAQIKEHIDADLPEISGTFLQQFWPHIVKPFPAVTLLQFVQNFRQVQKTQHIARQTTLLSDGVGPENTVCYFNTTEALSIQPFYLIEAQMTQLTSGKRKISLSFQVEPGVSLSELDLSDFKFYLHADDFQVAPLLYAFTHDDNEVSLRFPDTEASRDIRLPRYSMQLANLSTENMLLPEFGREQLGLHLLHEYFAFKQKYQFVHVKNLTGAAFPTVCHSFTLDIETAAQLPGRLQLTKENVLLHCVPAINLYNMQSEPINLDHLQTEYKIIPDVKARDSVCAYTVNNIMATHAKTGARSELTSLHSFAHRNQAGAYYSTQEKLDAKQQMQLQVSFGGVDTSATQRLSCELLVYNGDYPRRYLKEGDVCDLVETISYGQFRNITQPTPVLAPESLQDLHWHLLKHLSFNLQSFDSVETLQALLRNYDWSNKAENKKRIAAIKEIKVVAAEKVQRGALRAGHEVQLLLDDDGFSTVGDAYLFAKILCQFFFLYADINEFVQVRTQFVKGHDDWLWSANV
jgi:type VI secretion system protein ImpG